VTGDEIMLVERMHERSLDAGERMFIDSVPSDFMRHRDEFRVERAHPVIFDADALSKTTTPHGMTRRVQMVLRLHS
jgi:hypothetical protein